jgi:hypothetical protein
MALQRVDARLDVGLVRPNCPTLVGNASIAYGRIDTDELRTGTCLRAHRLSVVANRAFTHDAGGSARPARP